MNHKEATRQCRKVGTAHATGDALRAMYADLISRMHGGNANIYFEHLQREAPGDDNQITEAAKELLRDRQKAWDVLMTQTCKNP